MNALTLEKIERLTTSSNLERGKSLYYSGQVSDFKITNNRYIQAKVNGNKVYQVLLEIQKDGYKTYCNCPYKSTGYCKHQVAVKITLMKAEEQAEIVSISERDERFLKYYLRLFYLFYNTKYKLFK